MNQKSGDVNQFWEELRKTVLAAGVSDKKAGWYVRWAKEFAVSIKGRPLRGRTADDVETFLSALAGQKDIRSWQVKEAFEALQILYHGFLDMPLALKPPITENQTLSEADHAK